ncbi:MAG TPA: dTDP-4-dehydrorhamnose 3,5-epimerase family protein [Candidatus Acidoferrales bacterium]|nr:dTDP-4-dehydrorhamnose 3,5-epimerase family protein [Candidatus Acidoferrales bacterium]
MMFESTPVAGAFVIRLDLHRDDRGFFARTFCIDEFEAAGIVTTFVQQSLARSTLRGTLRGMHFQREPHGEEKLVRCTRGRIFDAIVDLRPNSPSFRRVFTVELDAEAGDALFVPRGCAHGYQTLQDETDVLYAMSSRYAPHAARAIRYDDPALAIAWPLSEPILSAADGSAPGLEAALAEVAATC